MTVFGAVATYSDDDVQRVDKFGQLSSTEQAILQLWSDVAMP